MLKFEPLQECMLGENSKYSSFGLFLPVLSSLPLPVLRYDKAYASGGPVLGSRHSPSTSCVARQSLKKRINWIELCLGVKTQWLLWLLLCFHPTMPLIQTPQSIFWIELIGVTLVYKTIQLSSVQLNKTSSVHCIALPSLQAKCFSILIFSLLPTSTYSLTHVPSGRHHTVVCVCG